jgi:hypothetical protein
MKIHVYEPRKATPPTQAVEPDPIAGFSIGDAKVNEKVDILTTGSMNLPVDSAQCRNLLGIILNAARWLSHEIPDKFIFSAGELFYKNERVEEVRVFGYIAGEPNADGGIPLAQWSTPVPPKATFDADNKLTLAPEDQGRTYLCAQGNGEALSVILDLRGNGTDGKPKNTRSKKQIPAEVPQQTFMEARNAAIAIADGPFGRRWEEVTGEMALRHAMPGAFIQTKLTARPVLDFSGLPTDYNGLRQELQNLELAAVLLLNVTICCVLKKPQVSIEIDELIGALGWKPRSAVERSNMRRKVWNWLLLFDRLTVHGLRPRQYKDYLTKEKFDLTSSDALIKITGKRDPAQLGFGNIEPPIEVSWVAGPWLDKFRGNDQVLQYFGDIRKIAAIPSGKAGGAWAQSIGLALNQLWRQRAARTKTALVGEAKRLTARFEPFTRLELLDMFRADPWVEDLLSSDKPHRAREYWDEAIRILKHDAQLISSYKEIGENPAEQKRKGWQEGWLQQELDIRPRAEGTKIVAELSRRNSQIKRSVKKQSVAKVSH